MTLDLAIVGGGVCGVIALHYARRFQPAAVVDVATLAALLESAWGHRSPQFVFGDEKDAPPEAHFLHLDSAKARSALGWRPRLALRDSVALTVEWYRAALDGNTRLRALSERQIDRYVRGVHPVQPTGFAFDPVFGGAAACA